MRIFEVRHVGVLEDFLSAVRDQIPAHLIHKFLRFAVKIKAGSEFNHIINDSFFSVHLEKRSVIDGEALCGRYDARYKPMDQHKELCPGCVAIARGVAVRDAVGR